MRGAGGFTDLPKIVILAVMFAALLPTNADPDLYGNLRFGLDLLDARRFSTVDPYSFTQDKPWVNHSWLPQVLMAVFYERLGPPGLIVLKLVVVGSTMGIVASAYAGASWLVRAAAVGGVLLASLPVTVTLRAQLFSFLGLSILCRLLIARRAAAMNWVPLLFLVWVNCHIGWTLGIAVLLCWTAVRAVRGNGDERRQALLVSLASILVTLVNPYGWQMWQLSASVSHLSRDISEWQPLWQASLLNVTAFAACIVLIAFALRRDVIPVERLLALAGVGYGAVNAVKFVHLFVLATVLLLAPAFVARRGEAQQVRAPRATGVLAINVLLLVGLLAVALAAYWPGAVCLRAGSWAPDPVVGQALRNGNVSGSIVVNFAWGEYVIWHFGPRLKVSFDPRYDLVYSPRTIAEQSGIRTAGAEAVAFLERAAPGYVWFPQSDERLKAWLVTRGYRIDVETDESFLAVRPDLPSIEHPGPQASGCFPSV